MEDKIKIVIADDRRLIRDSLRVVLSREKNIQIVGEATSGPETLDVIGDLKPDVLLIDYFMPGVDGVEAIPPIIEKSPNTKILMLTLRMDEAVIFEALKAGAKGYISKNASISDLVKAIQTVHEGELWVERKMISTFFEQGGAGRKDQGDTPKDGLTEREQEVLMCLTSGTTNKEIAAALSISEKTVKSHLNSIFRKLHVSRRLEAILYAINKGLT
jgi:NarL family two-component system response regulator LiaR